MKYINILYVINQNVSLFNLCSSINSNIRKNFLILSTNLLFHNEIEYIKKNTTDKNLNFQIFSDYLNDEEMELCDIKASSTFNKYNFNNSVFMKTSTLNKNMIVKEKLLKKYDISHMFHITGLGISEKIWGVELSNLLDINNKEIKFRFQIINFFLLKIKKNIHTEYIMFDNKKYFFLGNTNRLNFEKNIVIVEKNYNYILFVFLLKIGLIKSDYFISTIHNYNAGLADIILKNNSGKYCICIDGFNPSNMPKTYLDMFRRNSIFIIRDFIDKKWFDKFRKISLKPFSFFKKELFLKTSTPQIKNILLMLNHSADWSALINRSDTDILIESFVMLSKNFPNLKFVIRTHPTMTHPHHEGVNSIKRIKEYIKYINLKNLTVSNNTLEKDIKKNDLFLSEYSNAFVDCLKQGKLGLILNFTNRRNFMNDYQKLGFSYLDDSNCLTSKISDYINNIQKYVINQNKAVSNYNEKQIILLEGIKQ
ncbi:hypothetical protein [Sulfurimonas sp.]|uniref:hypothetical protein n=1 Tax=Sulfurimonas sp. TaxID=2022749 RepID=UPI002B47E891|nr:hypothetical protein [Sulfurimonas sp.]